LLQILQEAVPAQWALGDFLVLYQVFQTIQVHVVIGAANRHQLFGSFTVSNATLFRGVHLFLSLCSRQHKNYSWNFASIYNLLSALRK
jgi:hypothetical protein